MKEPKYKIGQKVYGRSDWFSGSYIPEEYVIRKIEIDGDRVLYKVKGRNVPFDEEMFFPTEAEAQASETERFAIMKKRELEKLKAILEERHMPSMDRIMALEDKRESSSNGYKYAVGQTVYGHMDGKIEEYTPETFVIKEQGRTSHKGESYNIYKVKGHGDRIAFEDYLYPTYEEALMADVKMLAQNTKGEVRSIMSRASNLGIEENVKLKLLTLNDEMNHIVLDNVNTRRNMIE